MTEFEINDFYDVVILNLMRDGFTFSDETRLLVSKACQAAYETLKGREFTGEKFSQYLLSALSEFKVDKKEFFYILLNYWSLSVLGEVVGLDLNKRIQWDVSDRDKAQSVSVKDFLNHKR
jgi:hypothetical protein